MGVRASRYGRQSSFLRIIPKRPKRFHVEPDEEEFVKETHRRAVISHLSFALEMSDFAENRFGDFSQIRKSLSAGGSP